MSTRYLLREIPVAVATDHYRSRMGLFDTRSFAEISESNMRKIDELQKQALTIISGKHIETIIQKCYRLNSPCRPEELQNYLAIRDNFGYLPVKELKRTENCIWFEAKKIDSESPLSRLCVSIGEIIQSPQDLTPEGFTYFGHIDLGHSGTKITFAIFE